MKLSPALPPTGDVLIYEYGARVDGDCLPAVGDQIAKARRLYNDLVAVIRGIVDEMRGFVLKHAGSEALALQARIDGLSEAFDAARAANDEDRMKQIAGERRALWAELGEQVKAVRKAHRAEIQELFLSRIGKKSTCDTYQMRCKAVGDGLGWATANQVLDAALQAFKTSFQRGQAPRFARGEEKIQDTLTLQFTAAGGVPVAALLSGDHSELSMVSSCGRRKYGSFSFRLGSASADTYANGTWQYHRPLPDGATVGLARLVRRSVGKDFKWALQLMVKRPATEPAMMEGRKPLVAVHFGWAGDASGRRVAGITDGADPGVARVLQLPVEVEDGIRRAAEFQSARDEARDVIMTTIKNIAWGDAVACLGESSQFMHGSEPWLRARLSEELSTIRRLPAQHVAPRRLHRLCGLLRATNQMHDELEAWRKQDRLAWQASAHMARRARNLRKDFYRRVAIDLARRYSAIVLEPLDLAAAALKVNEITGEKTEFAKKARSGRVVAAIYELESSIRWAAAKSGTALLDLSGAETAARCGICGGASQSDESNSQVLHCVECGAELDRKKNGAAIAWQFAHENLDEAVTDFWAAVIAQRCEHAEKTREKKAKMAEGRRLARTLSAGVSAVGSRNV
ncbi:hypothetical protein [Metallibacterium scheffleri]|uniref:Transposase n=1 Tax=Metallibacterium scheffleri TaxID=993689 RepID=A0A4S3KMD9_9GAMM|nr:hypothetical protein [Metallibacterium scheffleri]THD10077.1 hypothetical protein B1806_09410 [Metallibacterium scheffleri]